MRNPVHYGFCAALYGSSHIINILKLDQEIILSLLRLAQTTTHRIRELTLLRSHHSCDHQSS